MKNRFRLLSLIVSATVPFYLFCLETPTDPSLDPGNTSVKLFFPDGIPTAQQGVERQIGLEIILSRHIDSVFLTSSCSEFHEAFPFSSDNNYDTLYFTPVFETEGYCTLFVRASLNSEIKDRKDQIVFQVLPSEPSLTFSSVPTAFTTHTGKSDTLRFIVNSHRIDDINYSVFCDSEIDSGEMLLIDPENNDSAHIHFNPQKPGTYIVTLTATADNMLTADASIEITVLSSFIPSEGDNPQTLITGITDTLIYSLTSEQIANGVTMQLLDEENLPTDIATVIPSGSDSLLITVTPAEEGTLSFSIVTANSTLSDTTTSTFSFIDENNAVWATTATTADAIEGRRCSIELTPYLFDGVFVEAIAPTADIGTVNDSGAWYYIPPWGSEATVTATITGKRGETLQNLTITLTVTPGDTNAPIITLLSPVTESKIVGSSKSTVSVVAKDAGAGIDKVTFGTSSETIDGTVENDSTYSVVISGLTEGMPIDVIITATDGSMKKNSSTKTVSLTYDPAMEDSEAPVFSLVDGPRSGDRITTATGSIIYGITDDNGVDSVWWTLNDEFVSAISASDDNEYTISYELFVFGDNTVRLYAKDGASGGNMGLKAITLNYNTKPTTVILTAPKDKATGVSTSPTFEWSGGEDADGDGVDYIVKYGTTRTALSRSADVTGKTATVSRALQNNTTFYWQVTVKSTSVSYPDKGQSTVGMFTTAGSPPEITKHPQSQAVSKGESVIFSVIASANGGGTLTYKWLKNGTEISGAVNESYSISSAAIGMSGNTFECVVKNTVGEVISNAATLTVTEPTFTVSYNAGGGNGNPPVDDIRYQEGDSVILLPNTGGLVNGSQSFFGWSASQNGGQRYACGDRITVTEDITLYAQYSSDHVMDNDGNEYGTVVIGSQVWLKENFKVTHLNNGDTILEVRDSSSWGSGPSLAFCWYENDPLNKTTYGALYKWYAASDTAFPPAGWHLPTDAEWDELEEYCNNNGYSVGKSLAAPTGWESSSEAGTVGNDLSTNNQTGFSALPGGNRTGFMNIIFEEIGVGCRFWSATEDGSLSSSRSLRNSSPDLESSNSTFKSCGFSVRLVRNQ